MFITLCKTGEVSFHLIGTNGFHAKAKNDLLLRARVVVRTSHMKISHCRSADYVKKLHQKRAARAARAARLFFFIQPIKSLICGAVFAIAAVIS